MALLLPLGSPTGPYRAPYLLGAQRSRLERSFGWLLRLRLRLALGLAGFGWLALRISAWISAWISVGFWLDSGLISASGFHSLRF